MAGAESRLGEFDLIARIRSGTVASGRVSIGIGDDCAGLRGFGDQDLLVTTDMLMDGRHFRLSETAPERIGRKAIGVNLSDIAAMAGEALAVVVSVALPRDGAAEIAERLHRGMLEACDEAGVDLAGGDTNAWDGPLVVSVTAFGRATGRGPTRRSGARPGDLIYVTGPLGGSLLGRHLDPRPRLNEAIRIHEAVPIRSMIDLSDGLASDLGHILEESGNLGAILDAAAIPIHQDALRQAAEDGRSLLDHALTDGEDFELCFTVPPESEPTLDALTLDDCSLRRVGVVTETPGLFVRSGDSVARWTTLGFDHLKK